MSQQAISHLQLVRILYKSILRLHKGLPAEMKILGDQYVKDEFRRHKNAKPEEAQQFLAEWIKYGTQLSSQLGLRGPQTGSKLGTTLTEDHLNHFQEAQLGQLLELYHETSRIYRHDTKDDHL